MKTIGVLGGLGPQATMDFEARLHRAAAGLIPPFQNRGYPPLITYYHRRPPFVMTDLQTTAASPLQADPELLQAARWLGDRADFLVIPSNSPHRVLAEIEGAAGCPVLSMIEITLEAVRALGWRKVGVLGFGDPIVVVYTAPLDRLGLTCETLGQDLQTGLNAAILAVMEGRGDPDPRDCARQAVAMLRDRGVDGIILGCTEIPLLLSGEGDLDDLLNPAQLLADAAVRRAVG